MAELQPQPFKELLEHELPDPLIESALRLDLMTNAEIRLMGRLVSIEFFEDATLEAVTPVDHPLRGHYPQEPITGSLLGRYDAALKGLGRDMPLRAYELIDEVVGDPDATGADTWVATVAADGLSYVDPLAAMEQLHRIHPLAETRYGGPESYQWDAREMAMTVLERFPGAGEIPKSTL